MLRRITLVTLVRRSSCSPLSAAEPDGPVHTG
jgi:hypothetical protein